AEAFLCLLLALSHRLPDSPGIHVARSVALFSGGLLAGVPGWFFGTFSAFCAVVVLLLMLAGTLTGTANVKRPSLPGWLTYAGLTLGQLFAFVLPFSGASDDRSLVPLFFFYRTRTFAHVFSHVGTQALFLVAFLGARAFQKRYRRLADEIEEA